MLLLYSRDCAVRLTVYGVCANVQVPALAVIMSAIDGLTTNIQCYTKSSTSYDNSLQHLCLCIMLFEQHYS
jgi:hypothetical protein